MSGDQGLQARAKLIERANYIVGHNSGKQLREAIADAMEDSAQRAQQEERRLSFADLRAVNVPRCVNDFGHELDSWSAAEWTNAMCGEAGEAANISKKMLRHRDGVAGNVGEDQDLATLKVKLVKELADVVIYADLCAAALGQDLAQAVVEKFNEVSERIGSPLHLRSRTASPPAAPETETRHDYDGERFCGAHGQYYPCRGFSVPEPAQPEPPRRRNPTPCPECDHGICACEPCPDCAVPGPTQVAPPEPPRCGACGKRAVCVGNYSTPDSISEEPACGKCCAHEDGLCVPLPAQVARVSPETKDCGDETCKDCYGC